MLKRRYLIAGFLALAVAALGLPGAGKAGELEDKAAELIESLAAKAVASLTDESVPREERVTRFRVLLNEHFDVRTIGRWVLGRYWRKATSDERKEFMELFEDLIVTSFVDRFSRYSGETLNIIKSVAASEKDVIVHSEIVRPTGGDTIKVSWRVRAKKDEYKIIDVMVEGISMGQTQRSEFSSVIRKNGGKIKSLLVELRKRLNDNV